ncbi:MAG: hypothetical protein JNL01_08740 [Bdellovibrionales bacterium]|nr:hypothetical protein [Bdellovibrionales bacterium]
MQALWIVIGVLTSTSTFAGDLQGTLAGSYQKLEGTSSSFGMSARLRYMFTKKSNSIFIQANFPTGSLTTLDSVAGYVFRTQGNYFWEGGGGLRFSPFWGTGIALLAGFGAELSGNWYISIPILYKVGFSIEYTPNIGYRF